MISQMRCVVSCLGFLLVSPTFAQENNWIVLGTDAAASVMMSLRAQRGLSPEQQRGFRVSSSADGRTVAQLSPTLESLLQETVHEEHKRCGGFTFHSSLEAALSEVNNPFFAEEYLNRSGLVPEAIDQQHHVQPALALVDRERIVDSISQLEAMGTRYYQSTAGQNASIELANRWESYGAGRSDFSVALYPHNWLQSSVIATIEGVSSEEEIVVIGGHIDSISSSNTAIAPGADDDASGVAVVSEVLRVILASGFRPKRTLQFMAYAAEEVGLRGSKAIAEEYKDAGKNVVASLQLDMAGFSGSPHDMYFITDYVSADLTNFLKDLIAEYNSSGEHQISYGETACGYACSDHVSWTGTGVPSAFPFEALFSDYNENIHTADDVLENIDASGTKQALFAKLGVEFAMEISKAADTPPAQPIRSHGYAWANEPTSEKYTPAPAFTFNSANGAVVASRSGLGRYTMTFGGLGRLNRAGAHVQITGYGTSSDQCKVSAWHSSGEDLIANVNCFTPQGDPTDTRYSVLVKWP